MNENASVPSPQVEVRFEKAWLAILLAWVAGFVDVTGYLTLIYVFTSHMSGNSVAMMAFLAGHQWSEAARRAFPIPLFMLGIFLGTILGIVANRKGIGPQLSLALAIEGGLLLAFMVICGHLPVAENIHAVAAWKTYLLTALLAMAMGVQNSALRRVWGRSVHTTYVTGMLTHFTEGAAVLLFRGYERMRGRASNNGSNQSVRLQRTILFGGIWVAFVLGALCGGWGKQLWGLRALIAPLCVLAGISLYDLIRPVPAGEAQ